MRSPHPMETLTPKIHAGIERRHPTCMAIQNVTSGMTRRMQVISRVAGRITSDSNVNRQIMTQNKYIRFI